jgi:leader peptidase (prepilin peptidase)/N-methyltransferase
MDAVAWIGLGVAVCIGAMLGSFLNVVIHRTPRLIDAHDGRLGYFAFLKGISWPSSHCPKCRNALSWYENIPIAAYAWLRGRCRHCLEGYGWRYVAVELASAVIVAACFIIFGAGVTAAAFSLFGLGLLALTVIDLEEQLLPDVLVWPLLVLGLTYNTFVVENVLPALMGALAGFAALWAIRASYRLTRGIDGMGFGDLKLAAMIGAWLGVEAMPAMFFIAFASGVAIMVPLSLVGRTGAQTPVAFGPFLALAGLTCVFFPGISSWLVSAWF